MDSDLAAAGLTFARSPRFFAATGCIGVGSERAAPLEVVLVGLLVPGCLVGGIASQVRTTNALTRRSRREELFLSVNTDRIRRLA